jgi:hypothetical protein
VRVNWFGHFWASFWGFVRIQGFWLICKGVNGYWSERRLESRRGSLERLEADLCHCILARLNYPTSEMVRLAAIRPVLISQWRNMAVKSRAIFSVESCSTVNFILRLQLGYCQVVPGRFC